MPAAARGATGLASAAAGASSIAVTETAAGPQAGDVRYLFVNTSSSGGITVTPPAGWTTLLPTTVVGAGNMLVVSKPWVAGVGTETFTLSATALFSYEIVAVSGVDQGLTPQVATNGSATAATTLTTAGITPATSSGLLLAYFSQTESAASSTTFTGPTGMTVLDTEVSTSTGSAYAARVAALATTSAATGTFSMTSNQSGTWRTASLVIPSAATVVATGQFFPFLGLGGGVSR